MNMMKAIKEDILMDRSWLLRLINFWPPFIGAGIRVKKISSDYRSILVQMKLHFWNRNYVGTHFGGSLYAMTDPFLMLMLLKNLGSNYIIWDKAAAIRYVKPGRGTVHAHFQVTAEQIESIRVQADSQSKVEPVFLISILDEAGEVVAELEKTLYVRRKDSLGGKE